MKIIKIASIVCLTSLISTIISPPVIASSDVIECLRYVNSNYFGEAPSKIAAIGACTGLAQGEEDVIECLRYVNSNYFGELEIKLAALGACQANTHNDHNQYTSLCQNVQIVRDLARIHNLDGQNLISLETIACNNN